jgi:hypothetical protein
MLRTTIPLAAALAVASPARAQQGEVERVPITSLGTALVEIVFSGEIRLTGETKQLTYTQPLPATDDAQDIVSVEVEGHPEPAHETVEREDGRSVELVWTDPPAGELSYSITVTVDRHSFDTPIESDERGSAKKLLVPGPLTKPDAAVKKQARKLAEDASSDLEAALRIALWIHDNVEYDPHYSQDKKDKTVAKVMEVRRGTCDELSHLFIAMCRAVGIPAREVSGLAFTGESWGFHSWSEIRLGDRWVPVDATNAQVGFVDALHVAFARDRDDAKFSQGIQSVGTGMFTVLDHGMEVEIVRATTAGGVIDAGMSFDPPSVPPGTSFSAVLAVDNPTNSFLAGPARLVVPEGFEVAEPAVAPFLVAPGGHQTVAWTITPPSDLPSKATYWYRLGVVTFPHEIADAKLTIAAGLIGEVAALQDAGGHAVVAVAFKNPLDEDHEGSLTVCLHEGWDVSGEGQCSTAEALVPAHETEKVEFSTEFAVGGDFAVQVEAELGGLTDAFIQKVDVDMPE